MSLSDPVSAPLLLQQKVRFRQNRAHILTENRNFTGRSVDDRLMRQKSPWSRENRQRQQEKQGINDRRLIETHPGCWRSIPRRGENRSHTYNDVWIAHTWQEEIIQIDDEYFTLRELSM